MDLEELKVPDNYPFEIAQMLRLCNHEAVPRPRSFEWIKTCALAALYWRKAMNQLRYEQDVHGFDENRNSSFLIANAQFELWQEAAFGEGER